MPSLLQNTHFNIILQSTPRSLKWSLPFRYSDKYFAHTCHFCQAPHSPPPNFITIFGEGCKLWSSLLSYNFLKPSVASSPTVQIFSWPPCSLSLLISFLQHGWPTSHLMPIQKSNKNYSFVFVKTLQC
jgi:hypothetical protein